MMICPFCGKEMQKGILSGDGRSGVNWKQGERKAGLLDRIVGEGKVTAAKGSLVAFTIESYFCPGCRKMIFDTDITK